MQEQESKKYNLHMYKKSHVSRVFVLHQCYVYPAVHQLWSNSHQFVKISIIIVGLPFYPTLFNQSSNRHDKFCCLYTFDAINIHLPIRDLSLRPIFSTSFIDFEKVFKLLVVVSKEGSSLGIFGIKVLSWELCAEY